MSCAVQALYLATEDWDPLGLVPQLLHLRWAILGLILTLNLGVQLLVVLGADYHPVAVGEL